VKVGTDEAGRRRAPSEPDRARAIATIRACGTHGLLSNRQVDEQLEHAFRAKTVAELDAVLGALPRSPHVAAGVVMAHGLPIVAPAPPKPWWHGIVAWAVAVNVLWVVVWFITGGPVGWLVLAVASSGIAFTVRFASRHRRHVSGKAPRRRRRY
jgi:hypothetical protein